MKHLDVIDTLVNRIGVIVCLPLYVVGGIVVGLGFAWWAIEERWSGLPKHGAVE